MGDRHVTNNWNNLEEKGWITRAKNGDDHAFSKIIKKYRQPVFNFCYLRLANVTEAEDATQEILIRVYCKLNTYEETRGKFSTWLFSIASNYCTDKLRQHRSQPFLWDDLPFLSHFEARETFQPEKVLLRSETVQQAHDLLNTLPPDYRTVIILKYWHARSYQDIAQTLNTTVSAIKSKLFRARRKMAQAVA